MAMTIGGKTPQSITIGGKGVFSLAINGEVVWSASTPSQIDYFWVKSVYPRANSVYITKTGSPTTGTDLQYSTDGTNWSTVTYTNDEFEVQLSNNQKVYLRSTTGFSQNASNYYTISSAEDIEAGGDLLSLVDYSDSTRTTVGNCAFAYMFQGATTLIDSSEIDFSNITYLGDSSCMNMFSGCTLMEYAPSELAPATLWAGSYIGMFYGCESLTTAPDLSNATITTANGEHFMSMFRDCTSLTAVPSLPSTIGGYRCMKSMFQGCTSLTTVPASLQASSGTTTYIFESMFEGCTSLTQAPALPSMSVANSAYKSMFKGCTALQTAPALPATSVSDSAYYNMFYGCTALTTPPPVLPATSVSGYTYAAMFQGCTSLTYSPDIYASPTGYCSFNAMFNGCTSLSEITVRSTSWNTNSMLQATSQWVQNVASSGTFYNLGGATIPTGTNGIPTNWAVKTMKEFYIKNLYNGANTISIKKNGAPTGGTDLAYSTDGANWTPCTYTSGTCSVTLNNLNDKLYLRSSTGLSDSLGKYYAIRGSQAHSAGGDLRHIYDYTDNTVSSCSNYAFCQLFENDSNLMSVQDVDFSGFTTLGNGAFCYTYYRCTGITSHPDLPAATIGEQAYSYMFSDCSGLTKAPAILATSMGTYACEYMFDYCTALVNPPTLPAASLSTGCFRYMFRNCTSLISAPALSYTSLAVNCFTSMFAGCSSIQTAPALPATVLANYCYSFMFHNCVSLTQAPDLPATALVSNCYNRMFYGCTLLSSVKTYAESWSVSNTTEWLGGTAATGDLYNEGGATIPTSSTSGIPTGWTEHKKPTCDTPTYTAVNRTYYCETTGEDVLTGSVAITLACATSGATIMYRQSSTSAGLPSASFQQYTGTFYWGTSGYIEAYATKSGYIDSASLVFSYTCPEPGTCPEPSDPCDDYENMGYSSYEDCRCGEYGEGCDEPVDCSDYENMGYSSYEECDCAENGNCPPEPSEPCEDWEGEGYSSYEECMCNGGYEEYCEQEPDYFYVQNEYSGSNAVTITKHGTPSTGTTLQYSTDTSTWNTVTYNGNGVFTYTLPQNGALFLRSSDGFSSSSSDCYKINAAQNYSVGGDVNTLIDYTDLSNNTIPAHTFRSMFDESSTLTDITALDFSSISTVNGYGMNGMFFSCSSITTGPDLSMITSVSHDGGMAALYQRCSSLSTATAPSLNPWRLQDEAYSMATFGWMASVAASGTMYVKTGYPITSNHNSGIPSGWTRVDI